MSGNPIDDDAYHAAEEHEMQMEELLAKTQAPDRGADGAYGSWFARPAPTPAGEERARALEEAAKAVEKIPPCPFGKNAPPNDLLPSDPCPVCGDLGTPDADISGKCSDPATIIRRLAALSPTDGAPANPLKVRTP